MNRLFPYQRMLERSQGQRLTAFLLSVGCLLAWLFLRLESSAWQQLRARFAPSFAHLTGRAPSLGDPLRYLLQVLAIAVLRPRVAPTPWQRLKAGAERLKQAYLRVWEALIRALTRLLERVVASDAAAPLGLRWQRVSRLRRRLVQLILAVVLAHVALIAITEPFDYVNQLLFVLALWGVAMVVRRLPGRFATLLMIVISVIVSSRYLWWRYSTTLNWASGLDLFLGLLLVIAETYAWVILLLGFVQTCWPLERKPVPLPQDTRLWPSVDLYIPTYNEDLEVVRNTVYAAKGIDWPHDKLHIYILDDGKRDSFRAFAEDIGVGYLIRPDNRHAKAGNLNYALKHTHSELIAIFDCDHVPVRSFLQVTCGGFLTDPKLALVQTPHHFLSPDPFERNLSQFRLRPNEGELFYGLIQDGNDLWNAAFFCGSCAVLRRSALESIGGFATETVTEDAHTALRLHRAGWNSSYLKIVQAAGLATESLSAHVGQRIRWARGMAQIFRTDNPLFGPGLTLFQRICYANAMLHFLAGLPRLIFLLAPLGFLYFHAYVIYASAAMIMLYIVPHMIHSSLTNSRMQGAYRQTFWGEVYETVLAWYIARPTTVALFSPNKGTFNVTAKGGLVEENHFDWLIAKPYLWLGVLNVLGLGFAVWRFIYGPEEEIGTVIVSSLWVVYNLLIIGAAMAVAAEVKQVRRNHRVQVKWPASLKIASGHCYPCELQDYSDGGAALEVNASLEDLFGQTVALVLARGDREFSFQGQVIRQHGTSVGLRFVDFTERQKVDFVQCTLARADAWLDWQKDFAKDRPLASFFSVLTLGLNGYQKIAQSLPQPLQRVAQQGRLGFVWLASFLPRRPLAPPSTQDIR